MRICIFRAIMAFALLSITARADIIVVPADFPTIQAAIDASGQGDTIMVSLGTYRENLDFAEHNVLLASFYLATLDTSYILGTIIDGDSAGAVLTFEAGASAIVIGFTLAHGADFEGAGIKCIDSNPIIYTSRIVDNYGPAIFCRNSSILIYGNIIYNNHGSGIEFVSCTYPSASLNLIYDNISPLSGGGIDCKGSEINLTGNTIAFNSSNSGGGINIQDTSLVNADNCILWGNNAGSGSEVSIDDDSYIYMTYSDIEGGWAGENNIDSDPLFCNVAERDFHLASSSPCVGSGQNGENRGALGIGCEQAGIISDGLIPDNYFIAGSYPNPFNSSNIIFFKLMRPEYVEIAIYDIGGKHISTIAGSFFQSGYHEIRWDAEGFPSGVYLARIKAGRQSQNIKISLLK
jgi:serine protease